MLRPRLVLAALAASAGLAAIATAAVKPESAIAYRQAGYTMLGWNFGPMAQMVRGKTPWDAAEFARRAERVAQIAPQLLEGFPEGSDAGAKTDAKPEIWKNMDDFKAKMDELVKQSKLLAEVSKSGDEAKMKEQFKETAGACKGCHDKYRNEE
ncbi:MAG: c-type cytochrome [Dokdonella sp.]|uniref:c-type cytochrome n=1 Tax=Dokdonella sp. TaxID=2291710 RepID=UPI003F81C140